MSVKFSNNGHSTLAASITTSDTSITVASGHGARFPSLSSGEYFYATLIDSSNNLEIVKCTARSSDVLTVTRAQESTTARAYAIGDRIELRVTAASIADATDIDNTLPDQSSASGKYLTSDGTNASWGTITIPSELGLQSQQVFTSSGTWTKPSGITKVKVIVTGGGGGGGATNDDDMAGGGGAGGTAIEIIDVSSVSSVSVTVGGGSSGRSNNGGNSESAGNTSSFGSYCTAAGGFTSGNGWAIAGRGGTASGGDINITGGDGQGGLIDNTGNHQAAGTGGGSFWGQGGRGGSRSTSNERSGQAYGSGGGGAANGRTSQSGAGGVVVVEEYK